MRIEQWWRNQGRNPALEEELGKAGLVSNDDVIQVYVYIFRKLHELEWEIAQLKKT